jgi:hypothetical protein
MVYCCCYGTVTKPCDSLFFCDTHFLSRRFTLLPSFALDFLLFENPSSYFGIDIRPRFLFVCARSRWQFVRGFVGQRSANG